MRMMDCKRLFITLFKILHQTIQRGNGLLSTQEEEIAHITSDNETTNMCIIYELPCILVGASYFRKTSLLEIDGFDKFNKLHLLICLFLLFGDFFLP